MRTAPTSRGDDRPDLKHPTVSSNGFFLPGIYEPKASHREAGRMDGWVNIKEVLGLSLLSPYCIPNHSFKTVSVHAFLSSPSHSGLYKLLGKQLSKIWPTLTCQTHVPHLSHGATSQYKRTLHYCYCQLLLLLASALTDKIRFFNPDVQH